MPVYRLKSSTAGRNMAGARSLWRATGMKGRRLQQTDHCGGQPSFTQFVPATCTSGPGPAGGARDRSRGRCGQRVQHHCRGTTALRWATTACCIRCPAATSSPTRWNTWSTRTAPMPWCASPTATRSPRHVDGRHAAEHPRGVRLGGPMEAGKVKLANPTKPRRSSSRSST